MEEQTALLEKKIQAELSSMRNHVAVLRLKCKAEILSAANHAPGTRQRPGKFKSGAGDLEDDDDEM